LTAKKLIKDGVLGEIVEFETHFDWDDPGWPSNNQDITEYVPGTGFLFGLGTHTVDQVLNLFGLPESVFAILRSQRDGSRGRVVDDCHTVILQYAGEKGQGVVATIKSTQVSPMDKQLSFWIRGRKGTYLKVRGAMGSTLSKQVIGTDTSSQWYHDIQESQIFARTPGILDPEFGKDTPDRYGEITTTTMYDSSFQVQNTNGRSPRFTGNIPTIAGNWRGYYSNVIKVLRG
jgi:predicted dehydrogenase